MGVADGSSPGLLVSRADGVGGLGAGHLIRQLALAEAWCDAGGEARLVTAGGPSWALDAWTVACGVAPGAEAPATGAAWWSFDGYGLGPEIDARSEGRTLVLCDHGLPAASGADLRVDQNLGAVGLGATDLVGPRFALLRRSHGRPPRRTVGTAVGRVLLTLGGSPPPQLLAELEALVRSALPGVDLRVATAASPIVDMAAELARADLAISAAGSTTWELLAWGVPSVLVAVAPNQEPVLGAVVGAGLAVDLRGTKDAVAALRELAHDAGRRQAIASAAQVLVDGGGARRVVVAMRSRDLRSRPVVAGDAQLLWDWANDPVVRASALQGGLIRWDDHVDWLERGLASADRFAVIVEDGSGVALGQVRLDGLLGPGAAVISVSVDAASRGRGLGPLVLRAGLDRFWSAHPGRRVRATVKSWNAGSLRSFDLVGFTAADAPSGHHGDLVELASETGA